MPLSIILPNLLTWDGERPVIGGLERLAWAVIRVARQAGYAVDVHQNGSSDWVRTVDGIPIRGHGLARLSLLAAMESIHHETTQRLYFSIMQIPVTYHPDSLVVSHGVWWDSPAVSPNDHLALCHTALRQAREVVSVDYNFLNVMRAVYPKLAQKITVIPNFADTEQFSPPVARSGPPMILFPRRLDRSRGLDLFLESLGPTMAAHSAVDVILSVDQNNNVLNEHLAGHLDTFAYSQRIQVTTTPFDLMPDLYRRADIVVIPSTSSEGTSLSCLEAMASGCAVVATDVGGLPNLIISGYNGLLVPPRPDAMGEALAGLVENRAWREELGTHARMSALALGRPRWETAWAEALRRVYGPPQENSWLPS